MKNVTLFLAFLSLPFMAICQSEENYSNEEGKVTQYEMSMTSYPEDPDAEALVLYEIGDYRFVTDDSRGFLLQMTIRQKIKILKQAGIKFAEFEIPYYKGDRDMDEIRDLKAVTYNFVDGKLTQTELNKSNIFDENINSRWGQKKFAMPDVKEGSVVEVSYVISTLYYFNMRAWKFQKEIPVVRSHLSYRAIPYYEYAYILKGTSKFDKFDSKVIMHDNHFGSLTYKEVLFTFEKNNIPAFKDEEFISSKKDYMMGLDFQMAKIYYPTGGDKEMMTTWPKICDELLKSDSFGKYIKNSEKEAKKILPTLSLDNNQLSNLEKIVNYVKTNYKWNEFNDKYSSQKLSNFQKTKIGNSADINLFMTGMLRAAGLQVEPVVLSTRSYGVISKNHPFISFLNYTVAMVDVEGVKYFVDATEPLLFYKELPTRCINVVGLVVKPKSEEWVDLLQNNIKQTEKQFNITIQPEKGTMNVSAKYLAQGNDAYEYRKIYQGKDENIKNHLLKEEKVNITGELNITENTDITKPFEFSFEFDYPVENTGDKLFVQPFCGLSVSDNPFKQSSRNLPIQLVYLMGDEYKATIEIPKGYKVEHLPKNISNINNKIIGIEYSAEEKDGKIEVKASYNFYANTYVASAYIPIKASMANIIKHFSEMIVLVKE